MGDKRMAIAGLNGKEIKPGMMRAVLVDLSGRKFPALVPFNSTFCTMDVGPIGSLLFVRSKSLTPIDGAVVFEQHDPRIEIRAAEAGNGK